ncbi:hypothetical protein [Streptomyces sp. NPDC094466]|uniref:hypothetical protein n=1 Tax=Streptomyces sp. NPDC094466 TaxID=3366065 RepID=UPI00381B2A73
MNEHEIDARVEELGRGLRRMAAGLLEAAADHPDGVRARELSAAARVLTNDVLPRLDGEAGTARPGEPEVQDAPPRAESTTVTTSAQPGSARAELVEMYLPDYERHLREEKDPVMMDPDLSYAGWKHLMRAEHGRGKPFKDAPLWTDTVPSRGKAVVRGVTSKTEIMRRLHHSYVNLRDLKSPDGELALEVYQGCQAMEHSRAVRDGDFVETSGLGLKLLALRWRALVIGAGRGEHARSQLLAQLRQLDVLASPLLELDTAFRKRHSDPSLGPRIAGAAHEVEAVLQRWAPSPAGTLTDPEQL